MTTTSITQADIDLAKLLLRAADKLGEPADAGIRALAEAKPTKPEMLTSADRSSATLQQYTGPGVNLDDSLASKVEATTASESVSSRVDMLLGAEAYDAAGERIGQVSRVYWSEDSGEFEWVTVITGSVGAMESFVPIGRATVDDRGLTVPVTKATVENAPQVDSVGQVTPDQLRELYRYYGTSHSGASFGRVGG